MTKDVLAVRNLDVTVGGRKLVEDVDFTIRAGERVGLIGESGSGKSLTALSVMGLLPKGSGPRVRCGSPESTTTWSVPTRRGCPGCGARRSPWSSRSP
ncbi:ATP-binding cassette domain-containing protein [Streptomyces sp. FXJ1.4098]|nr:ATP-binding cassette domain-containing protein [Streptomyces sp. FXJ1.4098]